MACKKTEFKILLNIKIGTLLKMQLQLSIERKLFYDNILQV